MSPPAADGARAVDPERLAAILDAEELSTSTSAPGPAAWLGDVVDRALTEAFDASLPAMGASAPWIAGVVLAVAAVLAVGVAVALVVRLRRAPLAMPAPADSAPLPVKAAPPSALEVERLLGLGDAPGALRALWRWVAAGVEARGFAHPSPDRTNRELLAEVRRAAPGWERLPTFVRLTNAVDGHLYGGVALDTDAVRALVPLAEQVAR